jgi:hypothetical protein
MAKKKARKDGEAAKSSVVEEKDTGESQKSAPTKNRNGVLILGFVVTFVVAFALAWLLFGAGQGSGSPAQNEAEQDAPPARTLSPDEFRDFLTAVEAADFNAMSRLGKQVFKKGDLIPNYENLFAEYALDGFPPFNVFGFYTVGTSEAVYRVILTMNSEDNSVESFMAEEMPVIQ